MVLVFHIQNPNITMDIIINNPSLKWNWAGISRNPNITMEYIVDNPYKNGIGMEYHVIQI